ncbi:MAG: DUF2807 domain-containing protein [Flavobacteriales bacterium]
MMRREEADSALELLRDLPAELTLEQVDRMVLAFPAVPAANAWYKNINLNSFIMTTAGTLIVAGLTFFLAAKSQVPSALAATPPLVDGSIRAEAPVRAPLPVLQMAEPLSPMMVQPMLEPVEAFVPQVKVMDQAPITDPIPGIEPVQPVTAEPLPAALEPAPIAASASATQLDLKDFTSVQARGAVNVTIAQGPFSVNVEGNVNAMDLVEVTVEKGVLLVDCSKKSARKRRDCKCDVDNAPKVQVTMPELSSVGVGGSGLVTIASFAQTGTVDLAVAGSGDIKFNSLTGLQQLTTSVSGSGDIVGDNAEVIGITKLAVAGSGDIRIVGRTGKVEVSVSGSGDVDASKLEAGTGVASIAGSGSVVVNTKGQLTKAISGSGKVRNTGSGGSGSSSSDEDQQ